MSILYDFFVYYLNANSVVVWSWNYCWNMKLITLKHPIVLRDQSGNAPSQWETMLHCNPISHWRDTYIKWSLCPSLGIQHMWPSGLNDGIPNLVMPSNWFQPAVIKGHVGTTVVNVFSLSGAYREHSVFAHSQWKMALHCNAISHWLGTNTEWSLVLLY